MRAATERGREDASSGLPPDPALRTLVYEHPSVPLRTIWEAYNDAYRQGPCSPR